MRTTLSIGDDVLAAAKAIAEQTNRSVGDVISDLARRALVRPAEATTRNGIALLPVRAGVIVTTQVVNALRDETA